MEEVQEDATLQESCNNTGMLKAFVCAFWGKQERDNDLSVHRTPLRGVAHSSTVARSYGIDIRV